MYTIVANGDNISSGINFYLVDTKEQLNKLYPRPGSKAYVIEDSKTYILSHKKSSDRWMEYKHVLTKYVDDSIEKALAEFTGDIDPETIRTMIENELAYFNWEQNSAFIQAVNSVIRDFLGNSSYVTKDQVEAMIADAIKGMVYPDLDLSEYLTKLEAARRFVQVHNESGNDTDLIYVAGVTLQDI